MARLELACWRLRSGANASQGVLYQVTPRIGVRPARRWLAWTLEDEYRLEKVHAETRIPAGRYRVALRTEGDMHARYAQRFGAWHRGMLWLLDVPNYEWVYLHILNREDQTAGCVGVGESLTGWDLGESTSAYRRVYELMAGHLQQGGEVSLEMLDVDEPNNL